VRSLVPRQGNHKMKTIEINTTNVVCSHEIKTEKNGRTSVTLTVKAGDGPETTHIMTIGPTKEDSGVAMKSSDLLPVNYDQAASQRDFDKFRNDHAALAESNMRAQKLAAVLE
jgi:hypothetical protein